MKNNEIEDAFDKINCLIPIQLNDTITGEESVLRESSVDLEGRHYTPSEISDWGEELRKERIEIKDDFKNRHQELRYDLKERMKTSTFTKNELGELFMVESDGSSQKVSDIREQLGLTEERFNYLVEQAEYENTHILGMDKIMLGTIAVCTVFAGLLGLAGYYYWTSSDNSKPAPKKEAHEEITSLFSIVDIVNTNKEEN